MPRSITPTHLARTLNHHVVIDVRREPARFTSGLTVPGAVRRQPGETEDWANGYSGRSAVVFCVHGHEVSQNACASLSQAGIDAAFLEGGFEAWREAGFPVVAIEGAA